MAIADFTDWRLLIGDFGCRLPIYGLAIADCRLDCRLGGARDASPPFFVCRRYAFPFGQCRGRGGFLRLTTRQSAPRLNRGREADLFHMARLNLRIVMAVGLAVAVLVAPTLVSAVPRVVVLGILPAIVGVALIAGALHGVVRQPTGAQIILATLSIVLSVVALWTLKRMLVDGAWATYLPYYAIAAAIPLVMIQLYSARVK